MILKGTIRKLPAKYPQKPRGSPSSSMHPSETSSRSVYYEEFMRSQSFGSSLSKDQYDTYSLRNAGMMGGVTGAMLAVVAPPLGLLLVGVGSVITLGAALKLKSLREVEASRKARRAEFLPSHPTTRNPESFPDGAILLK